MAVLVQVLQVSVTSSNGYVSRQHCLLYYDGRQRGASSRWMLRDLSTLGTFIRLKPLQPFPCSLRPHTVFKVGQCKLEVAPWCDLQHQTRSVPADITQTLTQEQPAGTVGGPTGAHMGAPSNDYPAGESFPGSSPGSLLGGALAGDSLGASHGVQEGGHQGQPALLTPAVFHAATSLQEIAMELQGRERLNLGEAPEMPQNLLLGDLEAAAATAPPYPLGLHTERDATIPRLFTSFPVFAPLVRPTVTEAALQPQPLQGRRRPDRQTDSYIPGMRLLSRRTALVRVCMHAFRSCFCGPDSNSVIICRVVKLVAGLLIAVLLRCSARPDAGAAAATRGFPAAASAPTVLCTSLEV